jgi:hypothetical protein
MEPMENHESPQILWRIQTAYDPQVPQRYDEMSENLEAYPALFQFFLKKNIF